jgi:hypothetical protein
LCTLLASRVVVETDELMHAKLCDLKEDVIAVVIGYPTSKMGKIAPFPGDQRVLSHRQLARVLQDDARV